MGGIPAKKHRPKGHVYLGVSHKILSFPPFGNAIVDLVSVCTELYRMGPAQLDIGGFCPALSGQQEVESWGEHPA